MLASIDARLTAGAPLPTQTSRRGGTDWTFPATDDLSRRARRRSGSATRPTKAALLGGARPRRHGSNAAGSDSGCPLAACRRPRSRAVARRLAPRPHGERVPRRVTALSTDEGNTRSMCLAEALLRVSRTHKTIYALYEDKIAPADWGRHLGPLLVLARHAFHLGAHADGPRPRRARTGPASPAAHPTALVRRLGGSRSYRRAVGEAMRRPRPASSFLGETHRGGA